MEMEMTNIFKINKFLNILPIDYKIYIFEKNKAKAKAKISNFIIYISKNRQNLIKNKLDTSKIVGYINCVAMFSEEINLDDLSFTLELIKDDYVTYEFNNQNILDFYLKKNIILGLNEQKILNDFRLRLMQKELLIKFINITKKFRGKGIGHFLMILAATYAFEKYKISKIILDDVSNNTRTDNNLYVKLGLQYINKKPEPEMEGYLQPILDKWTSFIIKYTFEKKKFKPFFTLSHF